MTAGSASGVAAPVLVLALGNLLLTDDGAGLRLLERLSAGGEARGDVEFIDGGTCGLALLPYLERRRAVLILDAMQLGAAPGTVHVLDGAQPHQLPARHDARA